MPDRYDTTGNPEDEYYPGTSVLINFEDIHDSEELLERETELRLAAYQEVFASFDEDLTPDLPYFDSGSIAREAINSLAWSNLSATTAAATGSPATA